MTWLFAITERDQPAEPRKLEPGVFLTRSFFLPPFPAPLTWKAKKLVMIRCCETAVAVTLQLSRKHRAVYPKSEHPAKTSGLRQLFQTTVQRLSLPCRRTCFLTCLHAKKWQGCARSRANVYPAWSAGGGAAEAAWIQTAHYTARLLEASWPLWLRPIFSNLLQTASWLPQKQKQPNLSQPHKFPDARNLVIFQKIFKGPWPNVSCVCWHSLLLCDSAAWLCVGQTAGSSAFATHPSRLPGW